MESNPLYSLKNEISYKTLGRFLGLATMIKTYKEIYKDVPSIKTNALLDMLLDITNEYNQDMDVIDQKLNANKET